MAFTLNPFTGKFDYFVAGLTSTVADATYLRLDCTNDPLTANLDIDDTTTADLGVILKGANRFLHNFHHPTGGSAIPVGYNTFLGVDSGNFTMGSTATSVNHGSYNTGIGYQTGKALTTGQRNNFIGYNAGALCTEGTNNNAMGYNALTSLTTTSYNCAIGSSALQICTTGAGNTGVGSSALGGLGTGSNNVGIGYLAGQSHAGGNVTAPTNSVFIGVNSQASAANPDYEIVIGRNAVGQGSNTAIIGNTALSALYLGSRSDSGDVKIVTDAGSACDLVIDCGTNKTMRLAEPVYDDQQVNLGSVGFGSSAPSWTAYKGGEVLSFANSQSNEITFIMQLSHRYKTSGSMDFHIHTTAPDNNSGDVRWQFTYSLCDIGDDFPAETTVTDTQSIAANSQDAHLYFDFGALANTSDGVSAIAICSLTRLGSDAADTYGNAVYLVAADFHIPIDTMGSRQEEVK